MPPRQIAFDGFGVFGARAREIGVVEAQNEPPGPAPGEQPVQQRGAGVADVDAPRGRGRETDDRGRRHFVFIGASRGRGNMVYYVDSIAGRWK
jgi:hypothetical protein